MRPVNPNNPELTKSSRFWDKHARKYARSKISDEAEYENGLAVTRKFLNPSQQALEIGCGSGMTAFLLAPHVGHYLGTDLSPEMIAICNEKKAVNDVDNIEFATGAAINTNLPDESFDVVLAFNMLHLIDDVDGTIHHAHRLLKPGGKFISKTPCLGESGLLSLLRWPLALVGKTGLIPTVTFFDIAALDHAVRSAGFGIVHEYTASRAPQRRYLVAQKPVNE